MFDMTLPTTKTEYESLISEFESSTMPKSKWHHPQHVAVAIWYLDNLSLDKAIEKVCEGIKKLNAAHGVVQTKESGYHETWTIFFLKVLKNFMMTNTHGAYSTIDKMNEA